MEIGIIMKKKLLAAAVLLSATSVANAGFFGSLFGSDEETATTEAKTVTESVTDAAKSQMTSTVDTVKAKATTTAVSAATSDSATSSVSSGLLSALTSQLGVTDTQATGGMGSLMQLAQSSLSTDEFSELSGSVPNMSTLLAAAPSLASGDSAGGVTDLLSSAGGIASSVGTIATLTKQFEALGLSSDMITQFATIATSYFSSSSNGTASSLLQKGLGSILG
jgi:hypothetical protein